MLFLNVFFLNKACQGTEDNLHVHLETVVTTILNIQLLTLFSRHHTAFATLLNLPETCQ